MGLDSLQDLPPLAEFVPEPEVVEALERGLHLRVDDATRPRTVAGDRRPTAGADTVDVTGSRATTADTTGMRLQKVLARAGHRLAPRRARS